MPAIFSGSPDCDDCGCEEPGPPPYGLVVRARGCGCGCYDSTFSDWPIPWSGQSGTPRDLCGYTATIKSGLTVVATQTVSGTYPCSPARFLGLSPGTYTIEVSHPKFTTSTGTYTYAAPVLGDRVYSAPALCASTGHCFGCPEPWPDSLTLSITRDLWGLTGAAGSAIGPIPTDGLSVSLSWGLWPGWTDAKNFDCSTFHPNSLIGSYGWYGTATTATALAIATFQDGLSRLPCDPVNPDASCVAGIVHNTDVGHASVSSAPIGLAFWLRRCDRSLDEGAQGWRLTVIGPPLWGFLGGPYCMSDYSYFLTTTPEPTYYTRTCGSYTACFAVLPSVWEVRSLARTGATVRTPPPRADCSTPAIDFLDAVTDPVGPDLTEYSVWGTLTYP